MNDAVDRRDPRRPDRRVIFRAGGRRRTDTSADWLSVSDYARRYGVDRGTVYKWLNAELLDVYKMGLIVRIRNRPPDQHEHARPRVDGC